MTWAYFVLGCISYQLIKMLALVLDRAIRERRQKRFLALVNVTFPDKKSVTFIALDTSDRRSMAKLERQLREQYHLDEAEEALRR